MDSDHVLVASIDPAVREPALRWCAAAGVPSRAAADLDDARRGWRTARAVLVGEDVAPTARQEAWTRRERVHLVARDPEGWWRTAVDLGAVGVLGLADDASAVDALGASLDGGSEGCSVVVVGGSGGVGATTFGVALAAEAVRRGHSAVVVDADPHGPGVDLVLGAERVEGLRWPSLDATGGRVSPTSLAGAVPRRDGVATISWDVHDDVVGLPRGASAVWGAAVRAFDLVVVDHARSLDADGWSAAVVGGSVLTVVVVADDVAGVASARRVAASVEPRASTVVAVVATRRGGLGRRAVEESVGLPVVGVLRRDRRLRGSLDHGRGPRGRAVRAPAREVLDLVGLHRGGA